jgi:hypothetical protein
VRLARSIRARLGLAGEGVRAAGDASSAVAVNVGEQGATTVASTAGESERVSTKPDSERTRSTTGETTEEG